MNMPLHQIIVLKNNFTGLYHCDVTRVSRRLKSLQTRVFLQPLLGLTTKNTLNSLIAGWFPVYRTIMRNAAPCHDVIKCIAAMSQQTQISGSLSTCNDMISGKWIIHIWKTRFRKWNLFLFIEIKRANRSTKELIESSFATSDVSAITVQAISSTCHNTLRFDDTCIRH